MGLKLFKRTTEVEEAPAKKTAKKVGGKVVPFPGKKAVESEEPEEGGKKKRAKKGEGKSKGAQKPAELTSKEIAQVKRIDAAEKAVDEAKEAFIAELAKLGKMIHPKKSFMHPTREEWFSVMVRLNPETKEETWFWRPKPTGYVERDEKPSAKKKVATKTPVATKKVASKKVAAKSSEPESKKLFKFGKKKAS